MLDDLAMCWKPWIVETKTEYADLGIMWYVWRKHHPHMVVVAVFINMGNLHKGWSKIQNNNKIIREENLFLFMQESWDWCKGSHSNRTPCILAKLHWSGSKPKKLKCVRKAQSKPRFHSEWKSVARFHPSNLAELQQFFPEKKGTKHTKIWCSKLIVTYPIRPVAQAAAKVILPVLNQVVKAYQAKQVIWTFKC